MTLPQECDDVTRGVAIPKIREEGEKKKKKGQKKFLSWSPKRGVGRKKGSKSEPRDSVGPDPLPGVPLSRPCPGPPGSPRSSRSPLEPLRGERSPEGPRGRPRPTEQVRQPQ